MSTLTAEENFMLHLIRGMNDCKMKTKCSTMKKLSMEKIEEIARVAFSGDHIKQIVDDNDHKAYRTGFNSGCLDAKIKHIYQNFVI